MCLYVCVSLCAFVISIPFSLGHKTLGRRVKMHSLLKRQLSTLLPVDVATVR